MSVHIELAKHAEKQNKMYQVFLELDQKREILIEEAIELCTKEEAFSTDKINRVTDQINKMNLRFIPFRKYVSVEMVKEYVKKDAN
ncbi:DUF2533 family protein [Pseudoneobacillus rhizosphaerae]|uniref:DUF2533 family protein n=1 Tax=Pseudoneobacillus rhizosphaerae TaxID=2880968 RepID=A0A9C7GDI0_9BACI|nr:DUF2533 family protein [Pseudoneobacillus rhizosphaerae]CAG9610529.1 hypothetical protein NEOCIP111885_04304 [Pseudoneobacillus rhizosphaerae]